MITNYDPSLFMSSWIIETFLNTNMKNIMLANPVAVVIPQISKGTEVMKRAAPPKSGPRALPIDIKPLNIPILRPIFSGFEISDTIADPEGNARSSPIVRIIICNHVQKILSI